MIREGQPRQVLSREEIMERMTPDDLDKAMELVRHVVSSPEARGKMALDEGGFLLGRLEELVVPLKEGSVKYHQRLSEERESRREFLRRGRNWSIGMGTILLIGGFLGNVINQTIGPAGQERQATADLAYRKALEENNTLGVGKSSKTFSDWTVRYAPPELKLVSTNVTSSPLPENTMIHLPGNKLTELENTGIIIKEHVRTTDSKPVGKLAIVTQYSPPTSGQYEAFRVGEEWVLKDEPAVLIFENQVSGYTHYLLLTRSRALNSDQKPTFQLQSFKLQS